MGHSLLREVNSYNKDAINRAAFMPDEPEEDNFFSSDVSVEKPAQKHTGRLVEVNKGNKAGINKQRENLFVGGGNTFMGHNTLGVIADADYMRYIDELYKNQQKGYTAPTEAPKPVQTGSSLENGVFKTNVGGSQFSFDFANPQSNTFAKTTEVTPSPKAQNPMQIIASKKSTPGKIVKVDSSGLKFKPEYKAVPKTENGVTELNHHPDLPSGDADSKTASAVKGAAWQAAGAAALNAAGAVNTGDPRGLFDTLDPVYHLAGGRESGVGNALSDTGVALTKSGNPWLMLAGAGLKIVGGLTNAAFGMKTNENLLKAANENMATNRNFISNAAYYDDIKGPAATTSSNIYEGGWFSGGKADEKNRAIAEGMEDAYQWANRSVTNNIRNIGADVLGNYMRNYAALGGYFDRSKRKKRLRKR